MSGYAERVVGHERVADAVREAPAYAGPAGMVAGPLFVATVVALTAAEWDFLHRAGWTVWGNNPVPYPSYTALGPYGWVQVANFFVLGVLLLAFLSGFRRLLRGRTGAVGQVLLTIGALCAGLSAFRTDPVPGPTSWHGTIHALSFVGVAVGTTLGLFFAGLSLRRVPSWRRFGTGTTLFAAWQVLVFVGGHFALPGDANFYVFLVGLFAWFFLAGRRLTRRGAIVSERELSTGESV